MRNQGAKARREVPPPTYDETKNPGPTMTVGDQEIEDMLGEVHNQNAHRYDAVEYGANMLEERLCETTKTCVRATTVVEARNRQLAEAVAAWKEAKVALYEAVAAQQTYNATNPPPKAKAVQLPTPTRVK